MSRCAECLCVPQECNDKLCAVCISKGCCTSAHAQRPLMTVSRFFGHTRTMLAAALGIEILCIASAEAGENLGLYLFGLNPAGIAIAYAMGYGLAGLATFVIILGRRGDACCSGLEYGGRAGFWPNLKGTMGDFAAGIKKLSSLHRQPDIKAVLRSSTVTLVTAESACILTAETVGLLLYQYSILLSVPLALLAGALAIALPQAYKKSRVRS